MALGQRLEIRQGQGLVMTPQLQQAIKLLQLSNIELNEYCEQELEKNPLLERDESAPVGEAEREAVKAESGDVEGLDTALSREDFSRTEDMDASREDMYDGAEAMPAPMQSAPLTDWTTVRGHSDSRATRDSLESSVAARGTPQGPFGSAARDSRAVAGKAPDLPVADRCGGRSRLHARRAG